MPSHKIIVSPLAKQQIMDTERYIREECGLPKAAEAFLSSIEDQFSIISMFPNAYPVDGQASFLSGHQIRCASLKSHRMLYRVKAEEREVHILSLRISNENPDALTANDLQG